MFFLRQLSHISILSSFLLTSAACSPQSPQEEIETIGLESKDIDIERGYRTNTDKYGIYGQFFSEKSSWRVHGKGKTILKKQQEAIKGNTLESIHCERCTRFYRLEEWGVEQICKEQELSPDLRQTVSIMFLQARYKSVSMLNPTQGYSSRPVMDMKPVQLVLRVNQQNYSFSILDNTLEYSYEEPAEMTRAQKYSYLFYYQIPDHKNIKKKLEEFCAPPEYQPKPDSTLENDPNLALAYYNKRIQENPEDAQAYYGRGVAWRKGHNDFKAKKDFERAVTLNSNYKEVYLQLGKIHFHDLTCSDIKGAFKYFNKALEIDPECAEAYLERGRVYNSCGKWKEVIPEYNKALAINPEYVEAYVERGRSYSHNEMDLALADYNKAIAINPEYILAYRERAKIYRQKGELNKAINDYTKLIELKDSETFIFKKARGKEAYEHRASAYKEKGDLEKAIADYTTLIEDYDDSYYSKEYYSYRAVAYFLLGDYDKSWEDVPKGRTKTRERELEGFLEKLKKASGREE
ncbi:MAG: tetratricopeptide repeat protein [Planctomycetes bacterium]|nr:tetratricopeptide repeat protein [Planctomycetota bacterium]